MADPNAFTKLVPGFDFLQGLVKNAGSALPSIGQWVAPTLNPEELEKRIEELRTVQFWLEQNARMLAATIQALEVQRMTLSTLKTMNVQISDLRDSLTLSGSSDASKKAQAAGATAGDASTPQAQTKPSRKGGSKAKASSPAPAAAAAVDPMQWWGALTKQFTQLATTAMKDTATDAAKNLAGAMVKQSFDAAGETMKAAVKAPLAVAKVAKVAAGKAAQASAEGARAAKASRKLK